MLGAEPAHRAPGGEQGGLLKAGSPPTSLQSPLLGHLLLFPTLSGPVRCRKETLQLLQGKEHWAEGSGTQLCPPTRGKLGGGSLSLSLGPHAAPLWPSGSPTSTGFLSSKGAPHWGCPLRGLNSVSMVAGSHASACSSEVPTGWEGKNLTGPQAPGPVLTRTGLQGAWCFDTSPSGSLQGLPVPSRLASSEAQGLVPFPSEGPVFASQQKSPLVQCQPEPATLFPGTLLGIAGPSEPCSKASCRPAVPCVCLQVGPGAVRFLECPGRPGRCRHP